MFGFGKRSRIDARTVSNLGWDLHAHLIPGVDDGVRSVDEALQSIRDLKNLGYAGVVLTPHIYKDLYNNGAEQLRNAYSQLCDAVSTANIDFGIRLAAEYFGDEHFIALANSDELLTFVAAGRQHVLIEFPYIGEPLYWTDALAVVIRRGFVPVIAHPERYRYVSADIDGWLEKFGNYQVRYQCDLGSLIGQYGRDAAKAARVFLDRQLAEFWGSDLHRPSQVDRFIRPAVSMLGSGPVNRAIEPDQVRGQT